MATNEGAMSRIVWDMQTRFFIWHNFSYILLNFYILYPFLFVMAVLIFLGTDTTTTQAIPTKLTTLSPASTTRAAGTDTYYWKSWDNVIVYLIGVFDELFIITSFFAGFVHTNKGVTCSDSSLRDLSTAEECSGAVNYAKSFNSKAKYYTSGSWSNLPKGCYIYDYIDSGNMYFNTHSTGGKSDSRTETSICRKGNT